MDITIITTENRRLYPAAVYYEKDNKDRKPIMDIDDIFDILYKNERVSVISDQYDQYGNQLKLFEGSLEKNDIKAIFASSRKESGKGITSIMTLSEAAKKWGLCDGSAIRKSIERGKFKQDEIKQAGNVWVVTYEGMERVFGSIKNEENAYILYEDFHLTKDYYDYSASHAQRVYSNGAVIDVRSKYMEIKYDYIKKIVTEGLAALKNNKKVIVKATLNNQIIQIICTEEEYMLYIKEFYSRKNILPEWIDRLMDDLKE